MLEEAFVHAHASGDEDRAARLLQRVGLAAYRAGRIATLRRWLDLLGEDAIARNPGLALMASLIAALGGDPVAAERWSDAADAVRIDGPSLHGTASLRSSEAMVHAIMSRGARTRCSARRRLPSGKRRARALSGRRRSASSASRR